MVPVFGLTGGIGSGKSTVARLFEARGICCVDADEVAREVVLPGTPALDRIRDHFGTSYLTAEGALDRPRLRQRIFSDPEAKSWLEQLLHPLIRERTWALLAKAPPPYALLVSPLLLETGQHTEVEGVIVVDLPQEEQLRRTMARDGNSEEQVRAIMASQLDREARRARADWILDNSQGPDSLLPQIEALDALLRLRCEDLT